MSNKNINKTIRNKRKLLLPMLMLCLVVGGVAAVMNLSNSLGASVVVHSELPLLLSWNEDPSTEWIEPGSQVGSVSAINYTNLSPNNYTNLKISVVMTQPEGANIQKISLSVAGYSMTFTQVANVFTGTQSIPDITAGQSGSWSVYISVIAGAPDGAYTFTFTITGDKA